MIAVTWGVILSYLAWAIASEHQPTKRRYREILDRQTGRRVGVASEPLPEPGQPTVDLVRPEQPGPFDGPADWLKMDYIGGPREDRRLFPDRHPWLHRRLRRFGPYMRRQLAALEASYPAR